MHHLFCFEELDKEDKCDYLFQAWKEYKESGNTTLLERYLQTGFVFN
jgi:hypothetical protein